MTLSEYEKLKSEIQTEFSKKMGTLEEFWSLFGSQPVPTSTKEITQRRTRFIKDPSSKRGEQRDFVCVTCNKPFSLSNAEYKSRKNQSGQEPRFCSRTCFYNGRSKIGPSDLDKRLREDFLKKNPVKSFQNMTAGEQAEMKRTYARPGDL